MFTNIGLIYKIILFFYDDLGYSFNKITAIDPNYVEREMKVTFESYNHVYSSNFRVQLYMKKKKINYFNFSKSPMSVYYIRHYIIRTI